MKSFLSIALGFSILLAPVGVSAFETDQYNLPTVPLGDIGDEVSLYVEDNLIAAVDSVNLEIAFYQACLEALAKRKGCASREESVKRLSYLRSDSAVANAVFRRIGDGSLTITKTGKWFKQHKFANTPDRYKVPYVDSIYVFMPFDYATLSPTIRAFGTEFGTDKLEHMLQQGYKYHTIRNAEIARGKSDADAIKKAVDWGRRTERTYYGLLVSGVYSNADLYANYAGMRFYEGLAKPVDIGGRTRPPILELKNGIWRVGNEAILGEILIKPFLTDHLNEALNPSGYAFNIYPTVKRVVRDRACAEWRELLPDKNQADLERLSASLASWNGEDYGHAAKGRSVKLADTCFGQGQEK